MPCPWLICSSGKMRYDRDMYLVALFDHSIVSLGTMELLKGTCELTINSL